MGNYATYGKEIMMKSGLLVQDTGAMAVRIRCTNWEDTDSCGADCGIDYEVHKGSLSNKILDEEWFIVTNKIGSIPFCSVKCFFEYIKKKGLVR